MATGISYKVFAGMAGGVLRGLKKESGNLAAERPLHEGDLHNNCVRRICLRYFGKDYNLFLSATMNRHRKNKDAAALAKNTVANWACRLQGGDRDRLHAVTVCEQARISIGYLSAAGRVAWR